MNLSDMEIPALKHNFKPGIYKHYKGKLYRLIAVGRHSETLEEMVLYQELYGDQAYWVRSARMWDEMVESGGYTVKRFEWVREN